MKTIDRNDVAQASNARRQGRLIRVGAFTVAAALLLAGCVGSGRRYAPVEDKDRLSNGRPAPNVSSSAAQAAPVSGGSSSGYDAARVYPGSENAGKNGYYTVKPGDTIIRIGLETGQNWRDIARWNNMEHPDVLEVGRTLRVTPPGMDTVAGARAVTSSRVDSRPLDSNGKSINNAVVATPNNPAGMTPNVAGGAGSSNGAAASPSPLREGDDDIRWQWPSNAAISANFDEGKNKGIVFSGKAGDPVYAAADGRVMYSGSGLRGYGNLVILKHNNTYLTAYAHNQTLLVKEDQAVRRGQKIAEMGSSDASAVQLHFEIRKLGKPIDPLQLLPAR